MASAISETIGDAVVSRECLDLRLGELRRAMTGEIAEAKAELMKWMFGAIGLQILAILGGVAGLLRILH